KGTTPVETSGKLVGFLVTARDLTQRKKIEEKLLQTAKLQSLSEIASGIAHDFNNILTVILGYTELLLFEVKNEAFRKKLKIIEQAALGGAETVRKIEDFTRIKPKKKEFVLVDLDKIIHSALDFTSARWKDAFQKEDSPFQLNLDLKTIPSLAGNESDLREAIINIILNSLDAMPHGGTLDIATDFLKAVPEYQNDSEIKPEGFIQITITDTGIGMDEQTRKMIFDPFFSTKGVKGLGMGLSIAYGIIKRHHGDVKVESKKGQGATFIIYLPVLKVDLKQEKQAVFPPSEKQMARILVVDDEEENLNLMSELLEMLGYQVVTASNGEQGLEKFRTEGPYNIVFTDLGMPGISGWKLTAALKKLDPKLPVVLMTGWGFQLQDEEVKEKKVDYVISKPFSVKDITRVVNQILS
ncbi:MAG: response regulator, partial [bacterium]